MATTKANAAVAGTAGTATEATEAIANADASTGASTSAPVAPAAPDDIEMVESAVQAPDGVLTEVTPEVATGANASASTSTDAKVVVDPLADLRAFIQNEHDTHVPAMLAYRNAEVWCGRNAIEFRGNGKRLLELIYDGKVSDSSSEFVPNADADADATAAQ